MSLDELYDFKMGMPYFGKTSQYNCFELYNSVNQEHLALFSDVLGSLLQLARDMETYDAKPNYKMIFEIMDDLKVLIDEM